MIIDLTNLANQELIGLYPKVIKELKRISRPGLRSYVSLKDIPSVKDGLGVAVISTSKGLMTDKEAKKAGMGGEIICSIF